MTKPDLLKEGLDQTHITSNAGIQKIDYDDFYEFRNNNSRLNNAIEYKCLSSPKLSETHATTLL